MQLVASCKNWQLHYLSNVYLLILWGQQLMKVQKILAIFRYRLRGSKSLRIPQQYRYFLITMKTMNLMYQRRLWSVWFAWLL
nr:hypothetical protein Iba_chr10aCG4320 [Ipomoea batatas]GMD41874.1 hypothetical protein Iba_chr10bCG3890 [Ipomoea batatas]GMD43064.1 hypothetical protein Iba_chr10cCG1690 [Ipomoea batatas]GMD44831.1 hypothetical protein Iba_chr10dCG4260 [Ipomoea batatas]GMD46471.1 hypothetical protein Iba_chr10eCG3610 [Ipomoea batatas]